MWSDVIICTECLSSSDSVGQLDTVDLNKLNEIEGTLNKAKEEMKVSDLDRKVSNLENEAREAGGCHHGL